MTPASCLATDLPFVTPQGSTLSTTLISASQTAFCLGAFLRAETRDALYTFPSKITGKCYIWPFMLQPITGIFQNRNQRKA